MANSTIFRRLAHLDVSHSPLLHMLDLRRFPARIYSPLDPEAAERASRVGSSDRDPPGNWQFAPTHGRRESVSCIPFDMARLTQSPKSTVYDSTLAQGVQEAGRAESRMAQKEELTRQKMVFLVRGTI